jgi:cytochrome c
MDSFEINKLIGALLGTVFVVFSIGLISDGLFASPTPEKPGYEIVAAEAPADSGAAEPAAPQPIGPLLAKADPKAGEAIFKKCGACHTGEKGGANKVGPNLWGIVNRPVASHEGFSYSAGMKAFSDGGKTVWDYDHPSAFLTAPKADVKGTVMGFGGLKKIEDRAAIIAYLRTLADTPPPLPQ